MLRDEVQVALSDLIVACLEAADGHEAAAEILGADPLAGELQSLATARRDAASRLGEQLRALGDLPREPDTDLETVRELASRVRAALSADHRRALLEERIAAEVHLADSAVWASAHTDLSAETRSLVGEIRDQARAAADQLAAVESGI